MSNSTFYGFTGRILTIDLANRAVRTELFSAEEMRTYGGGSLLSAVLMLKNTRPGLDPMTGDGALVFASSVVAGLPFVGLARFSVCGKSPLTGGFGEARCEGPFGAGIKKSGYDAIVFEGRAPEPVVVLISDRSAAFSPAGGLWGAETSDATSRLREQFGFDAHVAVIGPAGEAGVRFAAISADLHHQAAGLGMGAAMGAKNLKAVVLTGGAFPKVADADKCARLTAYYRDRIALNPLTAWQKDEPGFSAWVELHGLDAGLCVQNFSTAEYSQAVAYRPGEVMKHYTGISRCPGCPNDCIKVMRTSDGTNARGMHQPAMGSLGPNLGIWNVASVIDANTRCQELGMDPISLGFTMSMAMECKKEAVGPSEFREAIPDFGDAERIAELIDLIGRRTGVGDLLAEGSRRLAAHLGEDAEQYAMHVKGQELPPIEPRTQTNLALGYAVSPVGPRLDICEHDWDFDDRVGWPHTLEYSRTLGILERIPMNELSARKVRNYKALSTLWSATDALNICIYATPPTRAMSVEELVELVAGVTGWETSAWELMRLGERRFHLLRMYNLREKFTAQDDTLPARFFTQAVDAGRLAGSRLDRDVFEDVKRCYYRMMGWTDDGVPRFETLIDHRIEWAAADAEQG